jgi:hypothetical protein
VTRPQRAHVFACRIGADTQEDLIRTLLDFVADIRSGGLSAGCSGSPSDGTIYAYRHDPAMTHDEYFRQLDTYLAKLKEDVS